jgi:hypothetical protein
MTQELVHRLQALLAGWTAGTLERFDPENRATHEKKQVERAAHDRIAARA